MKRASKAEGYGPAAIILGVTGHRDVLDAGRIKASVKLIIGEYRRSFPNSEIKLLTMLASGADSFAAEAALEAGIAVIGLLPMEEELYLADFRDEGDRARFARLLAACAERYTMPPLRGVSREDKAVPGPRRDDCYAYGGAFIVRHASALIAIWDGLDPGLRGGTADIVRSQLCATGNEYLRQADFLGGRETGPVHWIYARRAKRPDAPAEAPSSLPFDCVRCPPRASSRWDPLFPAGWKPFEGSGEAGGASEAARLYYESSLASIDSFNADSLRLCPPEGGSAESAAGAPSSSEAGSRLGRIFGVADRLALHFQKRANRAILSLITLGTATFAMMVVFDERLQFAFTLMALFASLIATWLFYRKARRARWDGRYFDYRSLAELSRVVLGLQGIGLAPDPVDLTTVKQQSLLGWVSEVVRVASIPAFFRSAAADASGCSALLERWVDAQAKYYAEGIERRKRALRPRKALRFGLFLGAIASAIGFFVVKALAAGARADGLAWWDFRAVKGVTEFEMPLLEGGIHPFAEASSWLQVAFDVLLSSGAAVALFMDMKAFEDEVRLFERSAVVFRRASAMMHSAIGRGDLAAFSSLALELGREAIAENFEWNDDHRSIPLEMPMG